MRHAHAAQTGTTTSVALVRPITEYAAYAALSSAFKESGLTADQADELISLVNTNGPEGAMAILEDIVWTIGLADPSGSPGPTLDDDAAPRPAPQPDAGGPCDPSTIGAQLCDPAVKAKIADMVNAMHIMFTAATTPVASAAFAAVPAFATFLHRLTGMTSRIDSVCGQPGSLTKADMAAFCQVKNCSAQWQAQYPRITSLGEFSHALGNGLFADDTAFGRSVITCCADPALTDIAPWGQNLPFPPAGGASVAGAVGDVVSTLSQLLLNMPNKPYQSDPPLPAPTPSLPQPQTTPRLPAGQQLPQGYTPPQLPQATTLGQNLGASAPLSSGSQIANLPGLGNGAGGQGMSSAAADASSVSGLSGLMQTATDQ